MGRDRTRVNIAVSPTRKQRWENHTESSNQYSNMSEMIRQSVEADISKDDNPSADLDIDFNDGEILQGINRLENSIDSVNDRVGVVEREIVSDNDFSILEQVHSALPKAHVYPNEEPVDPPGSGITTDELAEQTGIEEMELVDVLRFLEGFHPGVRSVSFEGERYSWKASGTANFLGGDDNE